MSKIKLNSEICVEHLGTLKTANIQWFNGYNWEVSDHTKLCEALDFFKDIKEQQREKLIKEGKI